MRRFFTSSLTAISVLIIAACSGSSSQTVTPTEAIPIDVTQLAGDPTTTIAEPFNIDTLDKQDSDFWTLRGYRLRPIPVSILGSSPQLNDDDLAKEWTAFLSGTTLVSQVDLRPHISYCFNGTMRWHESVIEWGEDVTWVVAPNNDSSESPVETIGGNSIRVSADDGMNTSVDSWGAVESGLVFASSGVHNGIDLVGDGGLFSRFAVTESEDC